MHRTTTTQTEAVRLRLTRRGRAVLLCATLAVTAAAGIGGFGVATAQADGPRDAVVVSEHTVAPGETLWAIAREATPTGGDVRDTVAELQRLNGLRGSMLTVGQQLLVPEA